MCGDYEHALEDLEEAINIDSTCSQAFFNQAVCFHTIRKYEQVSSKLCTEYVKLYLFTLLGYVYKLAQIFCKRI